MSRKFTIEQVKEVFDKFGLKLLEDEAKGIDYSYKCVDEKGYLYSRSTHSLQTSLKRNSAGYTHIFSIKNPYFYENMLHYMDLEVNNGTVLLTAKEAIKDTKQPLKFRCGRCGREYNLSWHSFMDKEYKVCNFCFNQMRSKGDTATKHVDTNKFHLKALESNLVILSGPDIKYHDKVFVQDKEGYRGLITSDALMKGSSFERFAKCNPYTIDNMRVFALHKDWDCVIYNQEYKGDKHPVKMLCSCGNEFEVDVNHFVAGKYKCNECRVKQSAIASKVELWLNQNNIEYVKEKFFEGCINKRSLPFDFYLPKFNCCIEVDGLGHYRPVGYGGKQNAQKNYEDRVRNDAIKTSYCKEHDIPLLRLPFWILEKDEHEKILKDFILSIEPNELNK